MQFHELFNTLTIFFVFPLSLYNRLVGIDHRPFLFNIHIPIWQHGSCIHLAMATKPPPISINSLHPYNAI